MNKFIIRVANCFDLEVFSKFTKGTLISDARLWKNEYILETNMSFDEVRQLPFIMAIKNITNTDKDFIRGRRLTKNLAGSPRL